MEGTERDIPSYPKKRTYHTSTAVVKMSGAVITEASQFDSGDEFMENDHSTHSILNSHTENDSNKDPMKEMSSQSISRSENQSVNVKEDGITDRNGEMENGSTSPSSSVSPTKSTCLFNPFDRDLHIEDDHFDENLFIPSGSRRIAHSIRSESFGSDDVTEGTSDSDDVTFADLGLAEDHFSHPEGHFGLSNQEEMELAINTCKKLIKEAKPNSDKYKNLVKKLVQLRLKQQEMKEGPESSDPDIKAVTGHTFKVKQSRSSKHYCEKCNAVIWGMIQEWYRCLDCGYSCHGKCLNQITRTCARLKVEENPTYTLSICPQKSLATQNYRCWECRKTVSYKSGSNVPRLCDYSGQSYCEYCHWNDLVVIPARVLHNWDFEPRKVSRSAKQFLRLMNTRAVIRIQDINPMLFNFVDELNEIKKLREELLIMKKYILLCPQAMELKLLCKLNKRQHFVESSDVYSMKDLMDVQSDALLSETAQVHAAWAQHIKSDCERCKGRGYVCELCKEDEILFPFDNIAVVCSQCSAVLHRHCFAREGTCPRCERRGRRNEDLP